MTSILHKILEDKRAEVETLKEIITPDGFESQVEFCKNRRSLKQVIANSGVGIIAEIKKRSPSKGPIRPDLDVKDLVAAYSRAGASAISILTDASHFGGSPRDLAAGRTGTDLPLLRKDFIIDEIQLYQARALGADIILLIAAALEPAHLKSLAKKARELELEVLLEVHSREELENTISPYVTFVGVNNRDLKTFEVSLALSEELAPFIPKEFGKIAESGISSPLEIQRLQSVGFTGFLIGETFLKSADPEALCRKFVEETRLVGG